MLFSATIVGWSLYLRADQARSDAAAASAKFEAQRDEANKLRREGRNLLYMAQMNLAGLGLMESGGIGRVEELTQRWIPKPAEEDVRGWEWYYLRSRCDQESDSFQHEEWLFTAVCSPDGKWLAAGDGDGTLTVRPCTDLSEYRALVKHKWHIRGLDWSFDSRLLASSSVEGEVYILDLDTEKKIATYTFQDDVLAVAWHPAKRIIAAGSVDGQVGVWDVSSGKRLHLFNAPAGVQSFP